MYGVVNTSATGNTRRETNDCNGRDPRAAHDSVLCKRWTDQAWNRPQESEGIGDRGSGGGSKLISYITGHRIEVVKRLFQLPREGRRVDHGIEAEVTVAPIARCGDVVHRAHPDEGSGGSVYRTLDDLVIPTRTELANHGPALPRATAPSRLPRAIQVPWKRRDLSGFSVGSAG